MIDFPNSPTDGQVFSASNGVVYKYSVANTAWLPQMPAAALTLYSEQVLAATTNAFQIQYPTTARLVEIWFDLVLSPLVDAGMFMKATQGGVPNTTSVYSGNSTVWYQSNTIASSAATNPYVPLIGTGVVSRGVMRLTKPGNFIGGCNFSGRNAANTFYNYQLNNETSLTGCDGVQVTTSGTFAIGSFLRTLVLP